MPHGRFLTAQEAADYLHIDLGEFFHLTVTKVIPSEKVDQGVFHGRGDLDRWRHPQ